MGAIDADHHHRGQGGELDCHPHQPDIVRYQRQVHREHQHLVHRVVEAQIAGSEPADLQLMRDIARAEDASGEADKGVERDEDDVEVVDKEIGARRGMRGEEKRRGEEQCQPGGDDIKARRETVPRQDRKDCRRAQRDEQHRIDEPESRGDHRRSPRNWSSACRSTVSKRSRIRKRKMPMTMKAMRMEKATLISTTSGMPRAPVAASTRPFSSDMKPTTWPTALRRVTMRRRPSNTTARAKARSSRAIGVAPPVTRSITTIDSATSTMPASMVGPMPTTVSTSR